MVEEKIELIDNFIELVEKADALGEGHKDGLLEAVSGAIDVKVHSLKTNYLTKRSYSEYKLRGGVIVAQNYIRENQKP
nr:hypothetical protein [uncultured Allomuricauda sp.]